MNILGLIAGLLISIMVSTPILKNIWEGVKTRKEDLEVDWKELEKAEKKL